MAVVAIATPVTVLNAYDVEMPDLHHVAVPIATAIIVPAWILQLSGVRWPRLALIAATILPNAWLTLVGHVGTNVLWVVLLVAWVGIAGTLAESIIARLSRELHDSVTQALYGIALYAEAGGRALAEGETGPAATNLREIGETTQEALGEMRLLLYELRPPVVQEQGLAAALRARLQAVESRAGLLTDIVSVGEGRLAPDSEQELYRVAQEALNNVLKHAHAAKVSLRLHVTDGHATMDVADDGIGFEPSHEDTHGFGLRGMHERVKRIGGTPRIESSPGSGTRIRVDIPR